MHDINKEHRHDWTPTQARVKGIPVIGIGGPVGSGKTALVDALCKRMRGRYRLGVVTNDIFTREDMEFLVRSEALPADRILGVQTGGCPHTAIREANRFIPGLETARPPTCRVSPTEEASRSEREG